ncbi:unnamed protein product [Penicillium glandicola]
MQFLTFALCTILCSRVLGHPYDPQTTWTTVTTTSVEDLWAASEPSEVAPLYGKRGYGEVLRARDTTATSASTTSTTSTTTSTTTTSSTTSTTSTTTSTTTTSTATATATSTTTTATGTTTTATTTTSSATTSTSTTTASTTTSTSSTTTTTTSTASSSSAAALAEWNRTGNITAIVFGCCMISLFLGVSILYCASDRARERRIEARKALDATPSYSKIPLVAKSPDFETKRSSMMFTNNPQTDYFPARSTTPSASNHNHTYSATSHTTASTADCTPPTRTTERFV